MIGAHFFPCTFHGLAGGDHQIIIRAINLDPDSIAYPLCDLAPWVNTRLVVWDRCQQTGSITALDLTERTRSFSVNFIPEMKVVRFVEVAIPLRTQGRLPRLYSAALYPLFSHGVTPK